MNSLLIPGCRHDILGHHLKAIGLLRVLATCAEPEHCDAEAEGWWDLNTACFHLHSLKYPTEEKLAEFFTQHYRPTPIFSPWNTGGGLDEKQELILKIDRKPVASFLWENRSLLRQHGYKANKHSWKDGKLSFALKNGSFTTQPPEEINIEVTTTSGRRPQQKVIIQWARSVLEGFSRFLQVNLTQLDEVGSVPTSLKAKLEQGRFSDGEFRLTLKSLDAARTLNLQKGILREIRTKTSGEKATINIVQNRIKSDSDIVKAIEAGRSYFERFQTVDTLTQTRELLEMFRDELPALGIHAMDAVVTPRTARANDNPLFLRRGEAGNAEIFRAFWSYFLVFRDRPKDLALTSLFQNQFSFLDKEKSPGSPFFPDTIETWNNGLRWVLKEFRFNALDYLLAVEGAFALRGAVSRILAANSRRFAAFPFVFDSGEDFVDDSNEVKGTASSIWLPLWDRPVTFAELESFICDAQARLPGKEARFSAEFARALRAQGVDAGFAGWQEFRFKMKASRVPWVCTGRYLGATANRLALQLNDALAPLDESGFLDQFEVWRDKRDKKIKSSSPHYVRADLIEAIELTITQPTPENALEALLSIYAACKRLTESKSLRDKIAETGQRVVFFKPLPVAPWENLMQGLEQVPEFRIARALASITGLKQQRRQANGKPVFSEVQPFLGSLLPLKKRGPTGWYLPTDSKSSSKQAVWSGTDLCGDLARVLGRRYLDSLDDDLPAIRSPRPAPLGDILAFLSGDLDDHRIAHWTEALSLIGWYWGSTSQNDSATESADLPSNDEQPESWLAIPPAYAALRALLEVECEWQGDDVALWKKRRSQRPIALLCQRSPLPLGLAMEEALRRLSIWGVLNCWGEESRSEKSRLSGRDIICADHRTWRFDYDPKFVRRLAAAVTIPLDWRDCWQIYRAVTLPQSI